MSLPKGASATDIAAAFLALSDGAYRLWHEAMAFCRKHQTDGRVESAALQGFRYHRPERVAELTKSLWEVSDGGYQIHDYFDWNHSKSEKDERRVEQRRKAAR